MPSWNTGLIQTYMFEAETDSEEVVEEWIIQALLFQNGNAIYV